MDGDDNGDFDDVDLMRTWMTIVMMMTTTTTKTKSKMKQKRVRSTLNEFEAFLINLHIVTIDDHCTDDDL